MGRGNWQPLWAPTGNRTLSLNSRRGPIMADIQVAMINASTVLQDSQVQAIVPALQTQVHRDFAPVWGVDADLTFVGHGATAPSGSWWLTVLDNSDQAGALGYHRSEEHTSELQSL